jgi:hypothetical protein
LQLNRWLEKSRWRARLALQENDMRPHGIQLELLDTGLRFGVWARSFFYRMVEYFFPWQALSPGASSDSTHALFPRRPLT